MRHVEARPRRRRLPHPDGRVAAAHRHQLRVHRARLQADDVRCERRQEGSRLKTESVSLNFPPKKRDRQTETELGCCDSVLGAGSGIGISAFW